MAKPRLSIEISPESAERLVIAADFAIRDGSNDVRCQSLALMSIAVSLHQLAALFAPVPDPVCKRCGLPPNAVIHSGRIGKEIGGHAFISETDTETGGLS